MRCRYCHQEGHNQRTCPKKTEAFKRAHDRDVQKGLTDSYAIRRYNARINPKNNKKKSSMRCGYCGDTGHTRRKCPALTRDKITYEKHHNMVLRIAHDFISTCNVGIGSLFIRNVDGWDPGGEWKEHKRTLVLVDFEMHPNLLNVEPSPMIKLMDTSTGETVLKSLKVFMNGHGDKSYHRPVKLVSPTTGPISSTWMKDRMVSVDDLGNHPLFSRSGDKNQDHRQWEFMRLEQYKAQVAEDGHHKESALENLNRWTEEWLTERIHTIHKPEVA